MKLHLKEDYGKSMEEERWILNPLGYGIVTYCCNCGDKLTKKNCKTTDKKGMLFYNAVSEEGDDEGYEWRCFCDRCFDNVKDMTADEVCAKYEASEWEDDAD